MNHPYLPTCTYNATQQNWWETPKPPSAQLDYAVDITNAIDPTQDTTINFEISVSPSGPNEMIPSSAYFEFITIFGVQHTFLIVTFDNGMQGRQYLTQFNVLMSNDRYYEFLVYMQVPITLTGQLYVPPASAAFCSPVQGLIN